MKQCIFDEIVAFVNTVDRNEVSSLLKTRFPSENVETVRSVYAQEYQRKMKKNYHKHFNNETSSTYYLKYMKILKNHKIVGQLLKFADEVDLSPSLMAKLILEQHLAKSSQEPIAKNAVSQLLRNPSLIENPHLSLDIELCVINDDNYGPISDAIKQSLGHEYECRLKREVKLLGIPFLDENQLREKGYDKTPDVKLEVPIAVNGKIVNWIESKASFGDTENHNGYLKDQYWSYWNRFGPGLVIYWFGFIDELNIHCEKGIILDDHVPDIKHITFLSP